MNWIIDLILGIVSSFIWYKIGVSAGKEIANEKMAKKLDALINKHDKKNETMGSDCVDR